MRGLPKGVYDQLISASLRAEIRDLPQTLRADEADLSHADAIEYLAREVAVRVRTHLRQFSEAESSAAMLDNVNELLSRVGPRDEVETALLRSIREKAVQKVHDPIIPLSQSALITNQQGLNYHTVLRSELLSSDNVDLICPFIGNQGLNLVIDAMVAFGDKLRIITTTYLGGTNQRALERLAETGAQNKIVYERPEQKTGLHAKAWIFHRKSGFTTATVGSSNLSPRALVDGLEWNVRVSGKDAPQVLEELRVMFDRLWSDPVYETFDPQRDADRLRRALKSQRSGRDETVFFVDFGPFPHQQEALDELGFARLDGKNRNLVVAATGTGKTLLAAFDYQSFAAKVGGRPSLLFVAHREDILKQSLAAFRAVLRHQDFGELNVGDERADSWRHVFASVQSLAKRKLSEIAPEHFDFIVIDEFHHAEAPTYLAILEHFQPRQLLGLTATPERTDGKNVIDRFGTPTYELRLWHALDRNLLCPFHYFGIADGTDLSEVQWLNGRYADGALERLFVERGNDRAALIIRELREKASDRDRMRVVAFCATTKHADFMAERFQGAGFNAEPLHSKLSREVREDRVRQFRRGDLSIICTVDLFNEGVDVPEIDTVLFLRPTESATVFIQQLGRGLRNHPEKGALTVLDFVGQQNRKFRMDLRFRALTGFSRSQLERSVKAEFPALPPGCHIKLDRTTQERVLSNLRTAIPTSPKALCEELRRMSSIGTPITVGTFLQETGIALADLYRGRQSLSGLKYAAGITNEDAPEARWIGAFIHVDDQRRVSGYRTLLQPPTTDRIYERMLSYGLTRSMTLSKLGQREQEEMLEMLSVAETTANHRPLLAQDLPFALHSHYSGSEITANFRDNPSSMRQGTFYVKDLELDIHLVTLRKSERDFSPSTRYADYFIAPDKLHWESQVQTTASSPTGQRLMSGGNGRHLLFVRENKEEDGRAAPFLCLGFAMPSGAHSEQPIRLIWKLEHSVPDHLYVRLQAAAG